MHLNNHTTGQLERLQLLGCPVVIRDGVPHTSVVGLAVASLNSIIHALRVRSLQVYWRRMRNLDRLLGSSSNAFWESYMVLKYQARKELPSRWFNRA